MHHKFAIIDNSVVLTGSFNWTVQAVNSNQENVLIIENKYIATKFLQEFENLWKQYNDVIDQNEAIDKIKYDSNYR